MSCPRTHNTMSSARARTKTARSGVERTNHEATACILGHLILASPTLINQATTKLKTGFFFLFKLVMLVSVAVEK